MKMEQLGLRALVAACAWGLAACGGGGGSSSAEDTPLPSGLLSVSADNYQAVAQSAVSSALFLGDAGELVSGADAAPSPRLLRQAVQRARQGLSAASGRPALLTGVEVRDTLPCTQGGSIAMTLNDANNNGNIDAGDSLTLDMQACREEGALLQGRLVLAMQTLTGVFDSNNFSATLTMTMTGFSVSTGNDAAQGDGALSLSISQTPAGVGELTLSTPRLVMSGRVAGQNYATTITDTRLTLRDETVGGTPRSSISYASTLASSQFGNRQVVITTPQAFVIVGSDSYPSSGQLLARGQGNSAVRITALNATQVRLELDAGGDGSYETQVTKAWVELQ